MNLTGLGAMLNFKAQQFALKWAKEHLPEDKYQQIKKSYNLILKRTTIFVIVCLLPIVIAFTLLAIEAPFSKRAEADAMPPSATEYVMARVDYDGNFYWTHDSKKYEYPLEEYGFSSEDYTFGDEVKVYVDDTQNIIKVMDVEKGFTIREKEVLIGSLGAILIPVLITMCIYCPIAYRTFGRPWQEFCKEFNGR